MAARLHVVQEAWSDAGRYEAAEHVAVIDCRYFGKKDGLGTVWRVGLQTRNRTPLIPLRRIKAVKLVFSVWKYAHEPKHQAALINVGLLSWPTSIVSDPTGCLLTEARRFVPILDLESWNDRVLR